MQTSAKLLVVIFCFSLLFSGCAWVKEQNGGEYPLGLSTTGAATIAGAVLGGGVGAIIGSQASNVGAALAVGSIAGAGIGATIGHAFETDEKNLEEDRLKAERQDELIQANQRRIDEYKRGQDISTEQRGAFGGDSFINTPPGYRGNPRATQFSSARSYAYIQEAPVRVVAPPVKVSPPVKVVQAPVVKSQEIKVASDKNGVDLIPEVPKETLTATPIEKTGGLPPAKETIEDTEEVITLREKPKSSSEKASKEPSIETLSAEVIAPVAAISPKDPKAEDCSKAEQEFSRAKSSVSDADKLFYLRRALRLCPNSAEYHVAVGKIYGRLGRSEDAQYELQQALQIEPGNATAKQELLVLKRGAS